MERRQTGYELPLVQCHNGTCQSKEKGLYDSHDGAAAARTYTRRWVEQQQLVGAVGTHAVHESSNAGPLRQGAIGTPAPRVRYVCSSAILHPVGVFSSTPSIPM